MHKQIAFTFLALKILKNDIYQVVNLCVNFSETLFLTGLKTNEGIYLITIGTRLAIFCLPVVAILFYALHVFLKFGGVLAEEVERESNTQYNVTYQSRDGRYHTQTEYGDGSWLVLIPITIAGIIVYYAGSLLGPALVHMVFSPLMMLFPLTLYASFVAYASVGESIEYLGDKFKGWRCLPLFLAIGGVLSMIAGWYFSEYDQVHQYYNLHPLLSIPLFALTMFLFIFGPLAVSGFSIISFCKNERDISLFWLIFSVAICLGAGYFCFLEFGQREYSHFMRTHFG